MANMIPEYSDNEIKQLVDSGKLNFHEAQVYRYLRSLPGNYSVRFNYLFFSTLYAPKTGGGQIDFIVLVPGKGFVIVEVKGSRAFRSDNGHHQVLEDNGTWKTTNDPWEQSVANMHRIKNEINLELNGVPCLYANTVAFPNLRPHLIPKNYHPRQTYLVQADLADPNTLKARLDELLDPRNLNLHQQPQMSQADFQNIEEAIKRDVIFISSNSSSTSDELETQGRLTAEQIEYLRDAVNEPRLVVKGSAGSGKTLLALDTAKRVANGGRSVFICFNKLLGAWLRVKNHLDNNINSSVSIHHYDGFVRQICEKREVQFNNWINGIFDSFAVLESLEKAAVSNLQEPLFDSIMVDEAQDFIPNSFPLFELLLNQNGKIHFFFDSDQNFYQDGNQIFPQGQQRAMPFNCRNTRTIVDYAWKTLGKPHNNEGIPIPRPHQGLLDGSPPEIHEPIAAGPAHAQKVLEIVNQWLADGVDPSQIAILSPFRNGSCLVNMTQTADRTPIQSDGNVNLQQLDEFVKNWLEGKFVLRTTIKSFKGLEASHVVLAELPTLGTPGFGKEELYVGVTRACSRLAIVPTSLAAKNELGAYLM